MSLFLSKAGQAEIIRSAQKDDQYITQIHSDLAELFRRWDNRLWIKYDEILKIAVQIFYYSFHAVCSIQTIGEEYTGIIQIDSTYTGPPSRLAQVLCVSLEYGGELLIKRFLKNFRKTIREHEDLTPKARKVLLSSIDIIIDLIPIFHAIHRGLFYLNGRKYQLSKRLFGINYVLVRYWLKQNHSVSGYKFLGYVTLLQALISFLSYRRKRLVESKQSKLKELNPEVIQSQSNKICILCMDVRTNATALPCGHIFCWDCVIDWLTVKGQCPSCRELSKPSQAVFLVNYQKV